MSSVQTSTEARPHGASWQAEIPPSDDVGRSNWTRLSSLVERVRLRISRRYVRGLLLRRASVHQALHAIPERMQKLTNQAELVLELADDFRTGAYRSTPWLSLLAASAALIYAANPADIVPDALPVVGALDDFVVLGLALRFIQSDLRKYCEFKGRDVHDYF